ncbi:hypothetical protein YPPY98_2897, partial [Yersinia pestis PY-98]
MTENNR